LYDYNKSVAVIVLSTYKRGHITAIVTF